MYHAMRNEKAKTTMNLLYIGLYGLVYLVWMTNSIFGMYCWLVKGGPTMKYNLIATAGFKSSYINVPFE